MDVKLCSLQNKYELDDMPKRPRNGADSDACRMAYWLDGTNFATPHSDLGQR